MDNRRRAIVAVLPLVCFSWGLSAQEPVPWHDPSPHTVQLVTVEENVKLEVLDWGGSGRPLVLLAGLGNTAHVFDEFAPKLTPEYHVYGITRRGFGASSVPATGYSADQLGDDVLAVLDALKLNRPVLVGHSIAGEELSSVGTRHPERVAGLIYLDAGYSYAYYHHSRATLGIDLEQLRKNLDQLQLASGLPDRMLVQELLQSVLPGFEKDLQEQQVYGQALPAQLGEPPGPSADDRASFAAFRAYIKRVRGIEFPEADLRQSYESKPDGGVGKHLGQPSVGQAIITGEQKYTEIRVPVLAIYANPHDPSPYAYDTFNTPAERAAAEAIPTAETEEQAMAFETGVPSARVVRVPHANHYVFLSNEADVLREMHTFLATLP
jgi:pimeloyl-ACP methyl ester carboxylesterase